MELNLFVELIMLEFLPGTEHILNEQEVLLLHIKQRPHPLLGLLLLQGSCVGVDQRRVAPDKIEEFVWLTPEQYPERRKPGLITGRCPADR